MSSDEIPTTTKKLSYRIREATEATGIGRTHLYELIKKGILKTFKVGRSRFIVAESLENLLSTKSSEVKSDA